MTRQELVDALLAERFGPPVKQWHGVYGVPVDYAEVIHRRAVAAEVADPDEVDEAEGFEAGTGTGEVTE
ncbi:MAG TPA: hypothetical protein VIS06_15305 [Mycobacteriales bacterium]